MENYVIAKPERIWSRLAVEKIIRTHVLSTIACDFAHTEQGIYEFFRKTFYAYQYDVKAIKSVIAQNPKLPPRRRNDLRRRRPHFSDKVWQTHKRTLHRPTLRRYHPRRTCKPSHRYLTEFSLLHLIAHTPDMGPIMRPYQREMDQLTVVPKTTDRNSSLTPQINGSDHVGFADFLGEVKTAMVMNNWIEELPEEQILERFSVQPGDLYRTMENAKWLLHAIDEISPVVAKNKEVTALSR